MSDDDTAPQQPVPYREVVDPRENRLIDIVNDLKADNTAEELAQLDAVMAEYDADPRLFVQYMFMTITKQSHIIDVMVQTLQMNGLMGVVEEDGRDVIN